MELNPWQVESIQEFLVLKCPECAFDSKEEDTFQYHAIENHPLSFVLFQKSIKQECFEDPLTVSEHKLDIEQGWDNETKSEHLLLPSIKVEESSNIHEAQKPKPVDESEGYEELFHEPKLKRRKKIGQKVQHKCSDCDIIFLKKQSLKEHNDSVHEGKKSHQCTHCEVGFKTKTGLKKHTESVHEGKKYNCEKCEKIFSQKVSLNKHIRDVHDKNVTITDDITDKSAIKKEKSKVHKEKKSLDCSTCDYVGGNKLELKLHIDNVHEGKQFLCTICGVRCRCRASLKIHIENVHDGKKTHMCSLCGKSFSLLASLKVHISTVHEKNKPHECHSCDKRFGLKDQLKRHILFVHEGKKPHVCTMCGNTFAGIFHLNQHISVVHEGNKPHQCPVCG